MVERSNKLDVLWGGAKIAAAIGLKQRTTYKLLENGKLPGIKVGGQWAVCWAELHRFFDRASAGDGSMPARNGGRAARQDQDGSVRLGR